MESPSNPEIRTFGEATPERDHYVIFHDRDGGATAYRTTMAEHHHYVTLYGQHSADLQWSYGVPAGMRVA